MPSSMLLATAARTRPAKPASGAGSYLTDVLPSSSTTQATSGYSSRHPLSRSVQPSGAPKAPRRSPRNLSKSSSSSPGPGGQPGNLSSQARRSPNSQGNSSAGSRVPSSILQVFKKRRTSSNSPGAGVFQLLSLFHLLLPMVFTTYFKKTVALVSLLVYHCRVYDG